MRIDTQQHFWQRGTEPPEQDRIELAHVAATPDDAAQALADEASPEIVAPLLRRAGFDAVLAVPTRLEHAENEHLLALAARHSIIRGVVGWVDLADREAVGPLGRFSADRRFVGVCRPARGERALELFGSAAFRRGIALLGEFDLAFELRVAPEELAHAVPLVSVFPEQRFVLDRLEPPRTESRADRTVWEASLRALAQHPAFFAKLGQSRGATGASDTDELEEALRSAALTLGPRRLMFGSGWPFGIGKTSLEPNVAALDRLLGRLPANTREAVLGGNAIRAYGLRN